MAIEIKSRWTNRVLYSSDTATNIKECLEEAVRSRADLTGAVLTGADLTDADLTDAVLTRAVLTDAVLTRAVLTRAVLTRAVLTDAVLTDADLTDADLTGAVLTDAVLTDADLTDADLTGAVLTGADLTDADLTRAVLTPIKEDFFNVLFYAVAEIPGLRLAIDEGRVNGSTYKGPCACLLGTIGNIQGVSYDCIPGLKPNSDRAIERFFMNIKTGDTPETNQCARLAIEWIDEFEAILETASKALTDRK